MKKLLLAALLAAPFIANAQTGGFVDPAAPKAAAPAVQKGGFKGPGAAMTQATAAQIKDLKDNTRVVLKGRITSQIGHDKYVFEDSTGKVTVDIDRKDWRGLEVTPNDTVVIHGKVDHDFTTTEVDVKRIDIVK